MPRQEQAPDHCTDPHVNGADLQKIILVWGIGLFTMVVLTALYDSDKQNAVGANDVGRGGGPRAVQDVRCDEVGVAAVPAHGLEGVDRKSVV